nr:fibrohexamerin-like protein 8 [Pseudoips prasinana]
MRFSIICNPKMVLIHCLTFLASIYLCAGQSCTDGIERPCANYDMKCVGRVFARELGCSLRGKIPNSAKLQNYPLYYPSSSTSIFCTNTMLKGLSGFTVKEFYINRRNKTLVLELVLNQLEVETPKTIGYFYRKGKEPIVTSGYTFAVFRNYSLTLTVFNLDGRPKRDLQDYQVYAYISDADPPVGNDESFEPKDPEAVKELDVFFTNLGLSVREEAVIFGPLVMSFLLPCNLHISPYQDSACYAGRKYGMRKVIVST